MIDKTLTPIKRALLSVSDKTGLVEFGKFLSEQGVEILSTGGSAKTLADAGVRVKEVAEHTRFPEMMDGRVKTLHPRIHGGLLGRRGIDDAQMADQGIQPIDLVVVNLYPFAQTIARPDCTREEAIENIDIGGPSMLRAAAKNHAAVTVLVDAGDYDPVAQEIETCQGVSRSTRERLAASAFSHTAHYDGMISNYLTTDSDDGFPETLNLQFRKHQTMRYGENPHQRAAFYHDTDSAEGTLACARILQGKALSFNNVADADADPNTEVEVWGTDGHFGCLPIGGGKAYWFAAADGLTQDVEEVVDFFGSWRGSLVPAVIAATDKSTIIRNSLRDLVRPLKNWSSGRITLAGDAAHPVLPGMAQGANQALEDVDVLCQCLGSYGSVESALAAYEGIRIAQVAPVIKASRALFDYEGQNEVAKGNKNPLFDRYHRLAERRVV